MEAVILSTFSGLASGLSLIIAIGSQNAFVLRQGIRRAHVILVIAVCAVSDLILILFGVAGLGALIEQAPAAVDLVRWAGAAFLLVYAGLAARRAIRGGQVATSAATAHGHWAAALGTSLALTWLNPHVYLDTVLLLGSLANAHGPAGKWWFAAGAGLGSIAWFTALGFGARFLEPLFRRPGAWRVLDGSVAVVMATLAALLIV